LVALSKPVNAMGMQTDFSLLCEFFFWTEHTGSSARERVPLSL
jgi:hypothetical protein